MTYPADAQVLLDTARNALPKVKRAFIAGGPTFAKVCESLVVHPSLITTLQLQPTPGQYPGACAIFAVPGWTVTYVKDCYPTLREGGGGLRLPDADATTAWTLEYLANVQTLYNALADLAVGGGVGGGCANVTIGIGNYAGPSTNVCWWALPVAVADDHL